MKLSRKKHSWNTLSDRDKASVRSVLRKMKHRPITERQSIVAEFCQINLQQDEIAKALKT